MSWEVIKLGTGKSAISAYMKGDVISTIPKYKVEDKIVVNGNSCHVLSSELDAREEQLFITIVPKGTNKKEKSDDKSVEGSG